jgi:ribosome-associated translation inhibitor RaiA
MIKKYIPNALRKLYHSRSHIIRRLSFRPLQNDGERKELYIHVGMGKTGTTALQEFFWSNREELKLFGIDYPDYYVIAGAHHVISPHHPPFLSSIPFKPVTEWAREIAKSRQDKILLSSELIAWTPVDLIEAFCEELLKHFRLKIVMYIRRQDDQIEASYNQQVKAGVQKKAIQDALERMISRYDLREKINMWEKFVGKDNIIMRPYSRQQFHDSDIRWDFLFHVFGITDYSAFTLGTKNSNPRLSYLALEYKRLLNQLFNNPDLSNRYNDLLLRFSAETDSESMKIYSKRSLLSPSDRAYILSKLETFNAYLCSEFAIDAELFSGNVVDANDENWQSSTVTETDLKSVTQYIQGKDSSLYTALEKAIDKLSSTSEKGAFQQLSLKQL